MKGKSFLRRLLAGALLGSQAMAFSRQPASWAAEQIDSLQQAGLLRKEGIVSAYHEGTDTCTATIEFGRRQSATTQFTVTVLP